MHLQTLSTQSGLNPSLYPVLYEPQLMKEQSLAIWQPSFSLGCKIFICILFDITSPFQKDPEGTGGALYEI